MGQVRKLAIALVVIALVYYLIDMYRFPESYLSIERYHLKNEIRMGNEEAIEYYNRVYVANGRTLFDD